LTIRASLNGALGSQDKQVLSDVAGVDVAVGGDLVRGGGPEVLEGLSGA